jgi:plastocyanin
MRKLLAALAIALASQAPAEMLAAQAALPQVVAVELSSFRFAPAELKLRHGQAYRLHLVNTSGGGHDFAAPEFFAASSIAVPDRALVVDGKVKLAGKQSVDIVLTPGKAGTYPLRCTHFLHSSMGMSGRIIVE